MRVVFCWFDISGYMGACWRALARRPGIELNVIAFAPDSAGKAPFSVDVLHGVPHRLLDASERENASEIAEIVAACKPDVVCVSGWSHGPYSGLMANPRFKNVEFCMLIDTPWRDTIRQKLGWVKMRPFVRRLRSVVVAGERSYRLARRLGFSEPQIRRGTYGYDDELFGAAFDRRRRAAAHPKRFLFVGMYQPHKGLDVTLAAYAMYRQGVEGPWPLTCCGRGAMADEVSSAAGVTNLGFVQPGEQPGVFLEHGAFVIASRYEPWGVVIAEALASGMPVVCTEACGASVELVRSYYNGITVPTGEAAPLARAFRWVHDHYDLLPEMGRRGRELAMAFAADVWALRIEEMLKDCHSVE